MQEPSYTTDDGHQQTSTGSAPLVDDRPATNESLDAYVDDPDAFDKLGNPHIGQQDPGRCHVCFAWVRFPYADGHLDICDDCHGLSDAERTMVRQRVQDALESIWTTTP